MTKEKKNVKEAQMMSMDELGQEFSITELEDRLELSPQRCNGKCS